MRAPLRGFLALGVGSAILAFGLLAQGDLAAASRLFSSPRLGSLRPLRGSRVADVEEIVLDGLVQRAIPCSTSSAPGEVLDRYARDAEEAGARYLTVDREAGVLGYYAEDGGYEGVVALPAAGGGTQYYLIRTEPDAGASATPMERADQAIPSGAVAGLRMEDERGVFARYEATLPPEGHRRSLSRRLASDGWTVAPGEGASLVASRGDVSRTYFLAPAEGGRTAVTVLETGADR